MEAEVPNAGLSSDDSDPDLAAAAAAAAAATSSPLHHRRRQHQQQQQKRKKTSSFLAGFRDCHQEVVRYLVSVERVALEGPVVYGLEKHLTDLETFMQASIGRCDGEVGGPCTEQQQPPPPTTQGPACGTTTVGSPRAFRQSQSVVQDVQDERGDVVSAKYNHDVPIDESSFDSGCDWSLVGSACAELSMEVVVDEGGSAAEELAPPPPPPPPRRPDGEEADDDTTAIIGESELAENAVELMRLANSNPRINRILNELFVLMDDDYDDDDDDDDDGDDGIEIEETDGTNFELQDD